MLEDLKPPTPFRGNCKVAAVMETLSQSDQDILTAAIFDTANWPVKTLSRALGEKGIQISDTPITSHRFKNCACFRA
jgi:hypothetical protein